MGAVVRAESVLDGARAGQLSAPGAVGSFRDLRPGRAADGDLRRKSGLRVRHLDAGAGRPTDAGAALAPERCGPRRPGGAGLVRGRCDGTERDLVPPDERARLAIA